MLIQIDLTAKNYKVPYWEEKLSTEAEPSFPKVIDIKNELVLAIFIYY